MNFKQIIIIVFLFFTVYLLNININKHAYYEEKKAIKMDKIVLGDSPLRGRIMDRNGVVLVDNVGVLNIIYRKSPDISQIEEIEIAKKLVSYVEDYQISERNKKDYYLLNHNNGDDLITKEEYQQYDERKLTKSDLESIKLERIKSEDLVYSEEEEKVIYLYSLMNNGYYYQDKYLFKDIIDSLAGEIMELHLPNVSLKVTSKRSYPFGDTLRDIFGSTGSIPYEEVDNYLGSFYSLEDVVGISGLEKVYESVLKGSKAKYRVNDDYTLELVSEGVQGNDLYLNLDINLQIMLENTLKSEISLAKERKTSLYFHDAYSIIGEPLTGNILAMSGVRLSDDGKFYDISGLSLSNSFAMGSVVKGASSTVGYLTGAIVPGKSMLDSCVKLYFQPAKCSYIKLGYVDDITALKTSSNYFQFITAIKTTGKDYRYNMEFDVSLEDFNRYRDIFKSYGLGVKTLVDLPNEQIGMIGKTISGDLLLNLAIGQYDTYTPMELFQYINTIASRGKRWQLNLAKKDVTLLNEVNLDNSYYDRILEGFYEVFHGGTASSYAKKELEVSGKTGTSETFYDSDNDGVVDTKTINSTVAFFYPRQDPKYSMIIVAPNVTNNGDYSYPFTKNVSLALTNYMSLNGYLN